MTILVTFIVAVLSGVLLAEAILRLGSLGRPEHPVAKRVREAMERNRKKAA